MIDDDDDLESNGDVANPCAPPPPPPPFPGRAQALVYAGDWMKRYDRQVARVLEAGKRVLIYAGSEGNHYQHSHQHRHDLIRGYQGHDHDHGPT
jgi:hypothetical protein